MARNDPKTGKVESSSFLTLAAMHFPPHEHRLDGNLWVESGSRVLMKIDQEKDDRLTPKTASLGMYSVVADKKSHIIWVSAQQVDKIFRFDPATGEFTEFPLSFAQQDPRRIDLDPTNPNRVFFSGNTADRIGFIELLP